MASTIDGSQWRIGSILKVGRPYMQEAVVLYMCAVASFA